MGTEDKSVPRLLTGNEAVALAAIEAGARFFAGYPITPSSEIAETLSRELPKVGGVFIQMEDEIAAMSAIIGASLAGARTLTATSGPGFSLKQEAIGYACETEVPCVVVNVMRGGPSTGMPTLPAQGDVMQAKWGTHGDHPAIVLCPERIDDAWELTIRAFNIAEKFRTPVILLLDEIVGHLTEKLVLPLKKQPKLFDLPQNVSKEGYLPYRFDGEYPPPLIPVGQGVPYHVTGLLHDETGFPTNDPDLAERNARWLVDKVENHKDELADVELDEVDGCDILVFAYGGCARSARGAVRMAREKGLKVGLFKPRTLWPFPEKELQEAAKTAKRVVVAEMNLGQMAHEVEWALGRSIPVELHSKLGGEPILPTEILATIEGRD